MSRTGQSRGPPRAGRTPLKRLADMARWASRAAWSVLLLQQVADAWILRLPWVIWLGKLLPLLIFLPGMMRDNLRTYIWLCFVSLLYFIALVERLFARPDNPLAIIGMVAVVVLFVAAMLYVRWRARELRAAAGNPLADTGE